MQSLQLQENWRWNSLFIRFTVKFFFDKRRMFSSKLEPKILFLRLQSRETLLSHLMNSTNYFINIQLISFYINLLWIERQIKLVSGIINPTDGWK